MIDALIREASAAKSVCFYFVAVCGDCVVVTNSGCRFAWVVGRLDDGETLFVERSQFELIELGLS